MLLLMAGPMLVSCTIEGGWNQNQQQPGNNDDGVDVGMGKIAVDPNGRYFVSRRGEHLMYGDLESGESKILLGVEYPERLAFANTSRSLFLTSSPDAPIIRYDLDADRVVWRVTPKIDNRLQVSPRLHITDDDRFLLLTYLQGIVVLDASTGVTARIPVFRLPVRDVDILPGQPIALVTLENEWDRDDPSTTVVLVSLTDGTDEEITVPNCSDETVLTPDGRYAFLAPTVCGSSRVSKDPVSVIDLRTRSFVRNLPGFGPVAMAQDGTTAVAFMDAENLDMTLFREGDPVPTTRYSRYHIMLIDTQTLRFRTAKLGDELPRYALTPDGKMLLIDYAHVYVNCYVRILDIASLKVRTVAGYNIRLDEFVITSDSTRVFLIDSGFYKITIELAAVDNIPVDFFPTGINITPNDRFVLLGESGGKVHAYDTQAEKFRLTFSGQSDSQSSSRSMKMVRWSALAQRGLK
jgi:hypothetical protein